MKKTAFIFPGQGAQKLGMGQDFYEGFEESREVYDWASENLNMDMKALCFEERQVKYYPVYPAGAAGYGNCHVKSD